MNLFFNKKYFDGDISSGFVSLYISKAIIGVAGGLLGLFLPIFLFNLFDGNFEKTILYYGIGFFIYGITVISGARFLNRFGFRRALRLSVVFGMLFYLIFYFLDKGNIIYLIPLSIVILTLYRLTYWTPYHIDFAKFTDKKNRGKELSVINATQLFIGIFIPLVAGFLIISFGFDVLFIIAMILFLVSGIPFVFIPHTQEKFDWGVVETIKIFFSKEKRGIILAYIAYGAESVVGLIVWPIFIFQILKGNYFEVGAISTLIISISIFFQLMLGKYIDFGKKEKTIHFGSILYAIGWIMKIFIATAFHIFIIGAYHNIVSIFMRTPFDTLTYEIAADNGHYVDEFTVLYEVAINFGKTLMVFFVLVVSIFFTFQWAFVLAAISALLFNLLRSRGAIISQRGII